MSEPKPKSLLSTDQRRMIGEVKVMLDECAFDGVVILVSGTAHNKKRKLETYKEAYFLGNELVNQKLLEHFHNKTNAEPVEVEPAVEVEDDDDDGESWKHAVA